MITRAKFFPAIRENIFHSKLIQSQVDGMTIILDAWEKSPLKDARWLAYMLGTAYHETAGTMQPIHEYGSEAYFTKMYDIHGARSAMARSMGNVHPGDGAKYCGRGFVQLTWRNNYTKMGRELGVDLENNPDLAMVPDIATRIMFLGMTSPDLKLTFSGVNLQRYTFTNDFDWVGARHVINGIDHNILIAETAKAFFAALQLV